MTLSFEVGLVLVAVGAALLFATLSCMAEAIDRHARMGALKFELRRVRARRGIRTD